MLMMRTRDRSGRTVQILSLASLIVAGVIVAPAQAQEPPVPGAGLQAQASQSTQPLPQVSRPYRGLFGAGSSAALGRHLLDVTTSIYGQYGNVPNPDLPRTSDTLEAGWFVGTNSMLSFEKAARFTRFALRGEGAFRYYQDLQKTTSPQFRVEFVVDSLTGPTKRNPLRIAASAAYEPYYSLSIFESPIRETGETAIVPSSRDDLLFQWAHYSYTQLFAYEHQLSPRSYVAVAEDARFTQARTTGADVANVRAAARFGYRVSRYASLRLGYAYQTASSGPDTTLRMEGQGIEASLDYRRPLTPSRRTTVGFGAGSSRITVAADQRWMLVAAANLRHEFDGGWFVRTDFERAAQLVDGVTAPFFANTVTASIGGFAGRRVEMLATGGYSRGRVGFESDNYEALKGSLRMRLALLKFLAIDSEGIINQYAFDNRATVPGSVPGDFSRWAVRCTVTLWLPLSR